MSVWSGKRKEMDHILRTTWTTSGPTEAEEARAEAWLVLDSESVIHLTLLDADVRGRQDYQDEYSIALINHV